MKRLAIRAQRDLWPRLTWDGAPPRFYPAGADAELARRFGALLQLGITGGYYDMHLGHVVGDERRTVTQYGKTARVTFVALDGMVTNGLQSWFFFSSRRRHTRLTCDWSSDVCSSD